MKIACINYEAGNLASISNGLRSAGVDAQIIDDPKMLDSFDGIVLPGVGSFGDAMQKLDPFKEPLIEEIASGKPFLGICLGLHVLFEGSDENPGIDGIGIFKGRCQKFIGDMKIPHMGWNTIENKIDHPILEDIKTDSYFYFVHSYHAVPDDESIIATTTEYGGQFVSSIARDNVFATQFHPEKSADVGLKLLGNFRDFCKGL